LRLPDNAGVVDDAALDLLRQGDYALYVSCLFAERRLVPLYAALHALHGELARIPSRAADPVAGYIRLQWWREALAEIGDGKCRNHELFKELRRVADVFPRALTKERLLAVADAASAYIEDAEIPDTNAWRDYAERTEAPALGAIAAAASGGDAAAESYAVAVARVWGMIGTVTGLAALRRRRRVVWPESVLKEAGASATDVIEARNASGVRRAVARLLKEVETACKEADAMRKALPREVAQALFPLTALAIMARRDAVRLRKEGCDPYGTHNRRMDVALFAALFKGALSA
jgi:NADH dehydrogenase [ubiquinone] 1 alpha subcomplex assembly factor 6